MYAGLDDVYESSEVVWDVDVWMSASNTVKLCPFLLFYFQVVFLGVFILGEVNKMLIDFVIISCI